MRILFYFLLIILLAGCSVGSPATWQHEAYLIEIEACFGNYHKQDKPDIIAYLTGNRDGNLSRDIYISFAGNKVVEIYRKKHFDGNYIFRINRNRRFIYPWMSSCEGLREYWIDPTTLQLK